MERKKLRYGKLQMGAPDEHDVFIYVAVADNTNVDKAYEKFHLSKPEAGDFAKAWFLSERVKPDNFAQWVEHITELAYVLLYENK